ncbi:hypothetical protein L1987_80455 [Smallanthus sonchifolius]|uniref:Uncharacterized protein n=1 Tax=Smallanthus sonchifolius TaxID=185202 RepID=A0ACB8YNA8_9ASTR|nr:hypothetical protein L1987_80455 [Smallanthus sonchifolius]
MQSVWKSCPQSELPILSPYPQSKADVMCKFEDTDFDDLWLEIKAKREKAKGSSAKRKHVLCLGRDGCSGLK